MKKTVFLKSIAIFRDCYLLVCYDVTIIRIEYLFKVSSIDQTLCETKCYSYSMEITDM